MISAIAVFQLATLACFCADDTAAIEKALQMRGSFMIDNGSVPAAFKMLAKSVSNSLPDFEIKIMANDLKQEGITQNQIIRKLHLHDVPLVEVLTAITMHANPTRDSNPSDPQTKVIWVIAKDPQNANRMIVLITTREAAARRGDTLPDCFKPPT